MKKNLHSSHEVCRKKTQRSPLQMQNLSFASPAQGEVAAKGGWVGSILCSIGCPPLPFRLRYLTAFGKEGSSVPCFAQITNRTKQKSFKLTRPIGFIAEKPLIYRVFAILYAKNALFCTKMGIFEEFFKNCVFALRVSKNCQKCDF